jgi:hypothetical protein
VKNRHRIEVGPGDIAGGVPNEGGHCPVATAINRTFAAAGYAATCAVGICTVDVRRGGRRIEQAGKLPRRAMAFIERFDAGKPVKPIAFTLEIDEEATR